MRYRRAGLRNIPHQHWPTGQPSVALIAERMAVAEAVHALDKSGLVRHTFQHHHHGAQSALPTAEHPSSTVHILVTDAVCRVVCADWMVNFELLLAPASARLISNGCILFELQSTLGRSDPKVTIR